MNDLWVLFRDDDEAYQKWLKRNPKGYVLNANKSPASDVVILHRSSCRIINGVPAKGHNWTHDWIKVCSPSKTILKGWSVRQAHREAKECEVCDPGTL